MHKLYAARQNYLSHALEFTESEDDTRKEFEAWLPDNIIDAHSHSNLPEHVGEIADSAYNHMLSTFPSYSIEESGAVNQQFHPGKYIRSLRFPKTFRGINHQAANDYLLEQSPPDDQVAIFGLPENPSYTIDMLSHPRVAALKMYYSYLDPPATKIYEVFKPEILEAAEKLGVPIILHTPRVITESYEEVLELSRDFPGLLVAIAHLGSSKFDISGLQDAYDALAEGTDVMMDTALNPSAEVCLRALTTFGSHRIMFGSDAPLHLIRSVPFLHPTKGQRLATSLPYHWQDPTDYEAYKHLAEGAKHSHWLSLEALRTAIDNLPCNDQQAAKRNVFHDNAEQFYGF